MMSVAIVREVPDSFSLSLVAADPAPVFDLPAARAQHAVYAAALAEQGIEVRAVPADESHPDCPFVEDVAVVLGEVALVTVPGAPSRRREVGPVAEVLAELIETASMMLPATLDGGDVLVMGTTVYVGRSQRTNAEGIRRLTEVGGSQGLRVVPVAMERALHLKSVVNRLDDETILLTPGHVPSADLTGLRYVETAPDEAAAANSLAVGDVVLVPAGFAATAQRIANAGFDPVPVEVGEFAKADGGLTCLSLRL